MTSRRALGLGLALAGAAACEREPRAAWVQTHEIAVPVAFTQPTPAVTVTPVAPPAAVADEPDSGVLTVTTEAEVAGAAPVAAPAADAGNRSIDDLTIDDLRLIAVVAGQGGPAAMVTTPSGHGVTLRQGMYVGRAQGDAAAVARWRVARITPSRLNAGPGGELTEAPAEMTFERLDESSARVERTLTLAATGGRGEGSIRLAGRPAR